jgi:hypothetical protein
MVNWSGQGALLVAGFSALVAMAQALLFKGRWPRLASMLAGWVFISGLMLQSRLTAWAAMPRQEPLFYLDDWLSAVVTTGLISGAITGYVMGTFVGGVFLVAHQIRRLLARLQRTE